MELVYPTVYCKSFRDKLENSEGTVTSGPRAERCALLGESGRPGGVVDPGVHVLDVEAGSWAGPLATLHVRISRPAVQARYDDVPSLPLRRVLKVDIYAALLEQSSDVGQPLGNALV